MPMVSFAKVVIFGGFKRRVASFRMAGVHFVTFRRVLYLVESRFAWQAQYSCDVFRRCVAVSLAGAALSELLSLQEGKSELFFLVFHPPFISQRFYAFLFSPKMNTGNSQARLLT